MKFVRLLKSSLPNENSLGEPIANNEQTLQNFWNWFNGSQVVDKQGRPLVVYHGTKDKFDIFDYEKGNKYDSGYAGRGFYFTDMKDSANDYSDWKQGNGQPIVMSVYLNIKKPLFVDSKGRGIKIAIQEFLDLEVDKDPFGINKNTSNLITETAKAKGYDGIFYPSVDNDTVYVVFNSNQIKAVTNNTNYNQKDNSIYGSKL